MTKVVLITMLSGVVIALIAIAASMIIDTLEMYKDIEDNIERYFDD